MTTHNIDLADVLAADYDADYDADTDDEVIHSIDLTNYRCWDGEFTDDEDGAAFGADDTGRQLYKHKIWRLKHSDPNVTLLSIYSEQLSEEVCARIGIYLCGRAHIKNVILTSCDLDDRKMEHLFGRCYPNADTATRTWNLLDHVLGRAGITEKAVATGIMDSVGTSFLNLVNVDLSRNRFESRGLDVLIESLAGSPIESLDISCCQLKGIRPLQGARKLRRLKLLDVSGNILDSGDASTLSMLMDDDHPRLRKLDLQSCGIRGDLVEMISPALSKSKSLRYLILHNHVRGLPNSFPLAALCKAVHDTSSFEKTLASNHTIWKITAEDTSNLLYWTCHPNFIAANANRFDPNAAVNRRAIAWRKHLYHVAEDRSADMTPFMNMDVGVIPHLIKWIGREDFGYRSVEVAPSVFFRLWSCKMFRDRMRMASQINTLQSKNEELNAKVGGVEDENERLKEQIAKLMARDAKSSSAAQTGATSIAERVKARKDARKRGRSG